MSSDKSLEENNHILQKNILGRLGRVSLIYVRKKKNQSLKNGKDNNDNFLYVYKFEKGVPTVPNIPSSFLQKIQNICYSDFIKANLIVKLHSDLIGEDFYIVSNTEAKAQAEMATPGIVVYLPDEIIRLGCLTQEEVVKAHMVKKVFGGEFV